MKKSLTPHNANKHSLAKLFRRFFKSVTVHITCLALITGPSVYAQNLMQGLKTGLDIVQGGVNQMVQQRRQAAAAQAQMAQMNALQPQMVPSKYFPQCPVAKAVTDFPEGACQQVPAPGDQAGLSSINAFKGLAVSYESFFENLTAESQNGPRSIGLQCIDEEIKKTDAQLQDKINALTALINKVKKETQIFEEQNRKIREEMENNRDLLFGGGQNVALNSKNHLENFSPACQNYFKESGRGTVVSSGLVGLRDKTEVLRNDAGTFENNKSSYVADIKAQLNGLRKEIDTNGLSFAGDTQNIGSTLQNIAIESSATFNFPSMQVALQATATNFQREFKNIQDDLREVGFNIDSGDLDGDFNERMSRFSKGAKEYFRKEAITKCVTGEDRTIGLGLSTDQILNGLRHRSATGPATTLQTYKTALSSILNSDAFIEDKMAAIKRLDNDPRFGGVGEIYIQVQGADGNSAPKTPYGLFKEQISICESRIEQDETFSTDEGLRGNASRAEKIEDAEKALKKAVNLEKKFLTDLTAAMFDRVVNCKGIEPSEEKCSLESGDAFSTDDRDFCIANASTCATTVKGCYQEADTIVRTKKQKMETLAATFNAQVSNLVAKQEFFLNQIKAQVVNDAEFIKRFIPGASYAFPPDLFVKMPEEQLVKEFGVSLRGGGDLKNLVTDLPKKLESLKTMLESQKQDVNKELIAYLGKQRSGMEKDRSKWTDLKRTCDKALDQYDQAVAEMNQAQQEAFGQSQQFCQKYNALAQNPAAGCGQADSLFEDAMNASAGLAAPGAVRASALEFQRFCDSANNEGEDGERVDDDALNFEELSLRCDESGSGPDLLTELREEALSNMPSNLEDDEKTALEEFINGDSSRSIASFPRDLRNTNYFRRIIRPLARLNSDYGSTGSLNNAPDSGALGDERSKIEELRGQLESSPSNFCLGYEIERRTRAYNECAGKDGDNTDCYKEELGKTLESDNRVAQSAADVVGGLNNLVTNSDSGRIGERMRSIPCMAQQGFNGNQGFDLNSFDTGILGAQGASIINSLTR